MTGINRNRKLSLSEAWRHYWLALFPEGSEWHTDLEEEIRRRLYFPGQVHGFLNGEEPDREPPSWASSLEIWFQEDLVIVQFLNTELARIPLFANGLITALSNWTDSNPIDAVASLQPMTEREKLSCRDFVIAAVRGCGNAIQNHMLGVLKEAEHPKFEIYCRPKGDVFAREKRLPVVGLSEVCGIDIPQSALLDRLRLPKYVYVQVKLRKPSKSKAGPGGSFHEHDALLVEKMKTFIDSGPAKNASQAAKMVVHDASRREGSSEESVLRRLLERFSKRYPDYSNRRGRRGF